MGKPSQTYELVDLVIDEDAVPIRFEYREIPYVVARPEDADDIDEAAATGATLRERELRYVVAHNLREQELMRTRFTRALLLIFALVVCFAMIASLTPYWQQAKDALLIVLPAVTGFVGFAVGFYYMTIFGRPSRGS